MAPEKGNKLRSGYTTGACAAAAALGAARMLKEQRLVEHVELDLPAGVTAHFLLGGQSFDCDRASCFVVKDAGDDPDVTDGVEMHATVTFATDSAQDKGASGPVEIIAGEGIGTVTKPGLPVAVGEPAINPVPRQMIEGAVRSVFIGRPVTVTLSIPDGAKRSKRTLNERLGIMGGLSVLGTTGVVRPVSHRAWTDTIDVAIDVALASGHDRLILATGRTSEEAVRREFDLPEEVFVMMGDHVGYALEACHRKGVPRIMVAAQFAKLLKVACGNRRTHVDSSRLDLGQLASWSRDAGLDDAEAEKIECANTAREILTTMPSADILGGLVAERALARLRSWAAGPEVSIMLVGYDGCLLGEFRSGKERDQEP